MDEPAGSSWATHTSVDCNLMLVRLQVALDSRRSAFHYICKRGLRSMRPRSHRNFRQRRYFSIRECFQDIINCALSAVIINIGENDLRLQSKIKSRNLTSCTTGIGVPYRKSSGSRWRKRLGRGLRKRQKCMQTVFEVENLKPLASAHSCNLLRHL